MIFMMVPKEAFLSACSASVDLRASGKSRTAVSSSSTPIARPSSFNLVVLIDVTITCSSSAGSFFAFWIPAD